jgi:glycosyltransferase involved in cell wall biosynthesis
MPSWNKEQYIAEALESVFSQNTHYSYKIVIADDHSTDRTLDIVAAYENRYPGVITVLKSEINQKLYRNVLRAYELLDTPYFCVLDPDDYWISREHIQNALDFLSSHREYTIYSTEIQTLSQDGKVGRCGFPEMSRDSDFSDYLNGSSTIAFTQTCVYRNIVFSKGIPARMLEMESATKEKSFRGDSFRNFLHIREGKAHYEPKVDGCYRMTDCGVYQGLDELGRYLLNAELFADFWRYDNGEHYELLLKSYELFVKAREVLFSFLGHSALEESCLRKVGGEFSALQALYTVEWKKMERAWKKRLALKKRIIYRMYEKSLRKEFLRFGGQVW